MQRFSAVALLSCVLLLFDHPTIAQSNSGFEHARVSFSSVQRYVAADAIPRQLAPPPNLVVPPMYLPVVEAMLRDSPTFRRQCIRIAGEPTLTVRLTISRPAPRYGVRATTRVTRNAKGQLSAAVHIAPLKDTQELIAHEFEHIIEQLDGVDLAKHVALRNTGVIAVGHAGEMFETTRAQRVGLKVASELRR
jgi:hypothetical protein